MTITKHLIADVQFAVAWKDNENRRLWKVNYAEIFRGLFLSHINDLLFLPFRGWKKILTLFFFLLPNRFKRKFSLIFDFALVISWILIPCVIGRHKSHAFFHIFSSAAFDDEDSRGSSIRQMKFYLNLVTDFKKRKKNSYNCRKKSELFFSHRRRRCILPHIFVPLRTKQKPECSSVHILFSYNRN